MNIDQLSAADWQRSRAVRLRALADTPDAFGSTLAEERDQPESFWTGRFRPDVRTLAARLDDADVGVCVVARHDDGPDAWLYSMWVAPAARGRGVGDALLRAAVAHARDLGARRLLLDVGDHNAHAIALYARHGFEPTGRTGTLPPPREHVLEHERARELG